MMMTIIIATDPMPLTMKMIKFAIRDNLSRKGGIKIFIKNFGNLSRLNLDRMG